MIFARIYPSKCVVPVIVKVERHISRDIKGVRCMVPNRYPFHRLPGFGTWVESDHGLVNKSSLFDLRSTRIGYGGDLSLCERLKTEGVSNHVVIVTEEMPVCGVGC